MSQSQDAARYLFFPTQCIPVFDFRSRTFRFRQYKKFPFGAGLLHNIYLLHQYCFEANRLNRTLVIEDPVLTAAHNNGFDATYSWDKYLSLSDTLGNAGVKFIRFHDFTKISFQPKDIFINTHDWKTTREENEKYQLIIIKRKNPINVPSHPSLPFVRYFSEEVKRIGDSVVRKLGNEFSIMHVRRDDEPQIFPEIEPEAILSKIQGFIPEGSKLYIMTNEKDRHYFDLLRKHYDVYQYFDFEALEEILSGESSDNYMLFCVEIYLFLKAKKHIYTWARFKLFHKNPKAVKENKRDYLALINKTRTEFYNEKLSKRPNRLRDKFKNFKAAENILYTIANQMLDKISWFRLITISSNR